LNAQLEPLQYSAELLTTLFDEGVSADELKKDQKAAQKVLKKILEGNQKSKAFSIALNGKKFSGSVGLSEVAVGKVQAALVLVGATLHIRRSPRIRVW
jgi:hypothetical protein